MVSYFYADSVEGRGMKKLYIANWKSNKNFQQSTAWITEFCKKIAPHVLQKDYDKEIVIAPSFPSIAGVNYFIGSQKMSDYLLLGSQDISAYPAGAYTGAVSAINLQDSGVKYAIVGHSERRKYFHETHQDIALKIEQCLENSIQPILCIDADQAAEQFVHISDEIRSKIILAYEPIEYIGGTETQPVEDVLKVVKEFQSRYSPKQVIYGGSVNADSVTPFLEHDEISGFLVGGASLEVESFISLLQK